LAAAGLVVVMGGATVFTILAGEVTMALFPLVVGLLAAFVAYGRWSVDPYGARSEPPVIAEGG
jgi:hypothetical protein